MKSNRFTPAARASALCLLAASALLTGCRDDEVSDKLESLSKVGATLSLHVSDVECKAPYADGSRDCSVDYRIEVPTTTVTLPASPANNLFPAGFSFSHLDQVNSNWTTGYKVRISTPYDGRSMTAQEAAARLQRTVLLAAEMAKAKVGPSYDIAARAGELRDSYR